MVFFAAPHSQLGIGLFISVGILAGCGSTPTPPDSGVIPDARVFAASRLFGPCEIDSQCPGEGAICRRNTDGFPGGYCTIPCSDRTPCRQDSAFHHCLPLEEEGPTYCAPRCLAGDDCRDESWSCEQIDDVQRGLCVPVCRTDADCGAGAICNAQSGRCAASGTAFSGALIGESCEFNEDCQSGECDSTFGYCVGRCRLPVGYNNNTAFNGPELPAADCRQATDTICFPTAGLTASDLGACLRACTSDGDCGDSATYVCNRTYRFTEAAMPTTFENGICIRRR